VAKVVLVNPPAEHTLVGNNPRFLDEERGHNPPLGILYLAAMLEERSDHTVCVLDAQVEELSYNDLASHVAGERPDLVGITTMTFTLVDVLRTVEVVKASAPEARVVLGGPHVHLYPRESVELPGVDFAIVGEGEYSLVALCDRLWEPQRWGEVPGLVYRRNGEVVANERPGLIEDLDALPFPARDLTPYHRYSSVLARRRPVTTMFTSRGCPYRCAFCDRPHLGKKFRAASARRVADEMQECVEMGIHEILVYDDTFTVSRRRVLEICAEIQRRGLDVGWDIRARVDTVDEEMLRALRAAGCERIHYGVEAGDDRFMAVLRKGITVEQARRNPGADRGRRPPDHAPGARARPRRRPHNHPHPVSRDRNLPLGARPGGLRTGLLGGVRSRAPRGLPGPLLDARDGQGATRGPPRGCLQEFLPAPRLRPSPVDEDSLPARTMGQSEGRPESGGPGEAPRVSVPDP